MGFSFFFPTAIFSLLLLFTIWEPVKSSSDYTSLIYKGCADQKFEDPSGTSSQNLKYLFNYLITQSSKTNFSKTTSGDGSNAIFGLYQCRGDLDNVDCYNCVSQFPKLSRKLCGEAIAARIQLLGCYMRYEIAGFKQISSTELLYKYCKPVVATQGAAFEGERDTALEEMEKAEGNGGNGFYAGSYNERVYVLGQCEGDLAMEECGECVRVATERVKAECGDSETGQVYLHQCYVSYSYYPNGVDQQSSSPSPDIRLKNSDQFLQDWSMYKAKQRKIVIYVPWQQAKNRKDCGNCGGGYGCSRLPACYFVVHQIGLEQNKAH